MGRKHKNASVREHGKLSLRGVQVKYQRLPTVALDVEGLQPWQHAIALAAAMWGRSRFQANVGVNSDRYGVWQSCRFVVTSAVRLVKLDFSDRVVSSVLSEMREEVRHQVLRRGLSAEMADRASKELHTVPYVLCCFWSAVMSVVGSALPIRYHMLMETSAIRPVWLVPHKVLKSERAELPDGFLLVDRGLHCRSDLPLVQADPAHDPHRYVALASDKRCLAVVAHSLNGVVLGWSAHDRCYQVVRPDTLAVDRLMHQQLQLMPDEKGVVHLTSDVLSL